MAITNNMPKSPTNQGDVACFFSPSASGVSSAIEKSASAIATAGTTIIAANMSANTTLDPFMRKHLPYWR